jgi:hypothetical protein
MMTAIPGMCPSQKHAANMMTLISQQQTCAAFAAVVLSMNAMIMLELQLTLHTTIAHGTTNTHTLAAFTTMTTSSQHKCAVSVTVAATKQLSAQLTGSVTDATTIPHTHKIADSMTMKISIQRTAALAAVATTAKEFQEDLADSYSQR